MEESGFTFSLHGSKWRQGCICKAIESASGRTRMKCHWLLDRMPYLWVQRWVMSLTVFQHRDRHLVRLKGNISFVVQGPAASAALWTCSLLRWVANFKPHLPLHVQWGRGQATKLQLVIKRKSNWPFLSCINFADLQPWSVYFAKDSITATAPRRQNNAIIIVCFGWKKNTLSL